MKKLLLIFSLLICVSISAQSDYTLDENFIEGQFAQINKAEALLNTNDANQIYSNPQSPEFSELLHYRKALDGGTDFSASDFDLKMFGLGFCCFPYSSVVFLFKKKTSREERISFGIGACSNLIVTAVIIIVDNELLSDLNLSIF